MGGALQTIMSMLSLTQTMGIEGNKYVAYGISKILYSYNDGLYLSLNIFLQHRYCSFRYIFPKDQQILH